MGPSRPVSLVGVSYNTHMLNTPTFPTIACIMVITVKPNCGERAHAIRQM